MNSTSIYIFGIYQISLYVRDTLLYCVPGREETYFTTQYKTRGDNLRRLTGEATPFAAFLRANEEKAVKIKENIEKLIEDVYGENTTIMRVVGDLVEVDRGQHVRIYELVLGIYQTLDDIMRGYLTQAKKDDMFEVKMEDIVYFGEYYFRALAHYTILFDIGKFYREYSQAMHEAKGEQNPVAQFIADDLRKLFDLVNFMGKFNKVKDGKYWSMVDEVNTVIAQISGQRAIEEGQTIQNIFNDTTKKTYETLQDAENKWQKAFFPVNNEYMQFVKEQLDKKRKGEEN